MTDVDYLMVRFKRPYSREFKGTDLRDYGPFEEGDLVRLPEANAQMLADLGFLEEV